MREGLVDTTHLSPGMRRLVHIGYGVLLCSLLLLLLVDTFRGTSWMPISAPPRGTSRPATAPILAIAAAFMASVAGWAFLLTGASDVGRRAFIPAVVLYAYVILAPTRETIRLLGLPPVLVTVAGAVLVVVPVGVYLLTHRSRRWRERPDVELVAWLVAPCLYLVLTAVFLAMTGRTTWSAALVRDALVMLQTSSPVFLAAAVMLTVFLAPEPVNMAVEIGRTTALVARRRLRPATFGRLSLAAAIVPGAAVLPIVLLVGIATWDPRSPNRLYLVPLWLAVFGPPLALAAWAVRRRLSGRWTARTATIGHASAVASFVVAGLFVLAVTSQQDLTGWALGTIGALPPLLLFVVLVVFSVMTFGARFANRDGERAPRTTRMLLYFGVVMLTLSALFYQTNVSVIRGVPEGWIQNTVDNAFIIGTVFFLLPYLIWVVLRRPCRLTGEAAPEVDPRRRFGRLLPGSLTIGDVATFVALVGYMVAASAVLVR